MSKSQQELEAIIKKFKGAMESSDFETMFVCLSPDVLIVENGPKNPDLPFLGIEFNGHDGAKQYIEALSQTLDVFKWEYVEWISKVNVGLSEGDEQKQSGRGGGVVFVKGVGEFGSKKTGKKWSETFISRFEIGKEGKINRYETWADALSAYLATQT